MIKIKPIVEDIITGEIEAYFALSNGYMNMSSYAHRIRKSVEERAKKKVTVTSLVVALSRLRKELKKAKPLNPEVTVTNITTKLPLSEIVYENNKKTIEKFRTVHEKVPVADGDFFTATIGTAEIDIVFSSRLADKILRHFGVKPKQVNRNLAAIGIALDPACFQIPNTFFSLFSVIAKGRINLEEIVSTATELIFIVAEKDFTQAVSLFSEMHRRELRPS